MKKIYHIYTEKNGEMDWFLDENGQVITYWWCNDASWRGEYMNGLIEYLGVEIFEMDARSTSPIGKAFRKELKKVSV